MLPLSSFWRCAPGAVALLGLTSMASADDVLEEIVVTADFRERAAAEMPAGISVLDRETIEGAAIQHFEELISLVPNFNWSGDGNRARYFQIRGVGELEQYEGAPNPSVGLLIDDIDFSGIGTIATLYDIERVEVLRGPQGTRYGANALGGLVYLQSAEPTGDWNGHLRLKLGDHDAYSGGLALGGPGFRISAHHHQENGFRRNAYLGRDDTNGRHETGVRAKLLFEPAPDWAIKWTAMYADVDDGYDAFAIDNTLTVLSDKPGKDAQQSIGSSLKATWRGPDDFTLTSITSAAKSDIDFSFDADWGNPASWAPYTYDFVSLNHRKRRSLSQELRLVSATWLLGAYVMQLEDDLRTSNVGTYVDPFFDFTFALDESLQSRYDALNVALFGQLDVEIGESGRITLGLRVEDRSTDYADSSGLSQDPGETMVGGEVAFSHTFSDRATGFVALSKGYRAGGFNLGLVPPGRRQFEQEALWNIEAGLRSTWLDDRLTVNGSVFYSERRDQQVRTSFQLVPGDPASFVFFTDNAARGRTVGLEADLRWQPSEVWQFYLSTGLLRAEFEEFRTPQVNLSGRRQAHAPDYTLAAGVVFDHPGGLFARLDYSAKDAFYFDVSHDQKSESAEVVNARIGFDASRWSAEIWARNVFNERYAVRGFYFGNEPPDFANELYLRFGDPRQLGLTLKMRF